MAVWLQREVDMDPVGLNASVSGLYTSAEVSAPVVARPPATSTVPSSIRVAVWVIRA